MLVFAYPDADQTGPFQPEYERLPHVTVVLVGEHFSDSQTTDDQGQVLWTDLPLGRYRITDLTPSGYQAAGAYHVAVGGREPESQTLKGDITVSVALVK